MEAVQRYLFCDALREPVHYPVLEAIGGRLDELERALRKGVGREMKDEPLGGPAGRGRPPAGGGRPSAGGPPAGRLPASGSPASRPPAGGPPTRRPPDGNRPPEWSMDDFPRSKARRKWEENCYSNANARRKLRNNLPEFSHPTTDQSWMEWRLLWNTTSRLSMMMT